MRVVLIVAGRLDKLRIAAARLPLRNDPTKSQLLRPRPYMVVASQTRLPTSSPLRILHASFPVHGSERPHIEYVSGRLVRPTSAGIKHAQIDELASMGPGLPRGSRGRSIHRALCAQRTALRGIHRRPSV